MLIEIPEGTIGLAFDMLADAKLVLTDALIAESLAGRKAQGFDPGDVRRDRNRDDERRRRPKTRTMRKK